MKNLKERIKSFLVDMIYVPYIFILFLVIEIVEKYKARRQRNVEAIVETEFQDWQAVVQWLRLLMRHYCSS